MATGYASSLNQLAWWVFGLAGHAYGPCCQHRGSPYQNTTANLVHQKVVTKAMLVNRYARGKRGASDRA